MIQGAKDTLMKEMFSEYYKLSEEEIRFHWEKDIFCFDANVLLNLYRYTPSTRNAFFKVFEILSDRIWISYQAAYEYQKNRLSVINAQQQAYKDIREILDKKKNEIDTALNKFKKHPYLQAKELKSQIESAFRSIGKDLSNFEDKHPNFLENDPIFDKLTSLLEGKIGNDFEQDKLDRLYREGKKRYDDKVPPGYMDLKEKRNSGDRALYGDLIVWKQVIEQAKEIDSSIIFVTDDLKEDWWYQFKGKTLGPRPELIKEFKGNTSKRVNIYQADQFLIYANKNLAQTTNQDAIDEVRKVRLEDEKEFREIQQKFELSPEEHRKKVTAFENAIDTHLNQIKEDD